MTITNNQRLKLGTANKYHQIEAKQLNIAVAMPAVFVMKFTKKANIFED